MSRLSKLLARWNPSARQRATVARIQALEAHISSLQSRLDPVPGVDGAKLESAITIGGQSVTLRALPVTDWIAASEEIPAFLIAYFAAGGENANLGEKELETIVSKARDWVVACAPEGVNIELLTVPEAMHALVVIARVNGITDHLANFFQARLQRAGVGHHGSTVRGSPN